MYTMDRWTGRVALVTGAAGGIGAAIVRALVSHGMHVVGCDRNMDTIQSAANELSDQPGTMYAIQCDLRKEEEILAMFDEIKKKYGAVDVCINSAGIAQRETVTLLSGETEKWREMCEVNVLALSICTREAYNSMKERGVNDGHIIHLGSNAGQKASPNVPFYSATKFAITALTEGLRNELRQANSRIRITTVSPGVVDTELYRRSTSDEAYKINPRLDALDIANTVAFILAAPPHVQIHDVMLRPNQQIF